MHSEHRKRMNDRFSRGDRLEDHELLEMLLFYSRLRVNTNEMAHALLSHFGSVWNVLCASEDELCRVNGIGPTSARLIRLTAEIMRRAQLSDIDTSALLHSEAMLEKYLQAIFFAESEEKIYMLSFTKRGRLIGIEKIGEGLLGGGEVSVIKAMESAKFREADSVIIAHNHPSGLAVASNTDIETANKLNELFSRNGIRVHSHYVVTRDKCYKYCSTDKQQANTPR